VVAGDEDDRSVGQRVAEALELAEGEDDGGVGRAHRMKEIAGQEHRVGPGRDHSVNRRTEGVRHIGLSLVDAGGGLPVVLPETEMRVGYVRQFHTTNVSEVLD
jgi:hypothetical protein